MSTVIQETPSSALGSDAQNVSLTFNLSWIVVTKIALVWAAEYALLAIIEDASHLLKAATLVCAVATLFVLQLEPLLKPRWGNWFHFPLVVLTTIYLCFVGYALYLVVYQHNTRAGLEARYVTAGALSTRSILPDLKTPNLMSTDSVKQFGQDAIDWESDTAKWIESRMSYAGRERFLDHSSVTNFTWPNGSLADNADYDKVMNRLAGDKRNLAILLETGAYDR